MDYKVIGVKFDEGHYATEYAFACYDDTIDIGDLVVVDTRNGFQLARVTNLNGRVPEGIALKEVVDRVDTSAFETRKARAAKIKKLKSKIDKRVKEVQNMALYEMLAEKDPELKEMVSQLKELL